MTICDPFTFTFPRWGNAFLAERRDGGPPVIIINDPVKKRTWEWHPSGWDGHPDPQLWFWEGADQTDYCVRHGFTELSEGQVLTALGQQDFQGIDIGPDAGV